MLTSLYRLHAPALFRFALRLTGDRAAAEDLVADTFVVAVVGGGPAEVPSARAYLFGTLRNLALHGRRNALRRPRTPLDLAVEVAGPSDPERDASARRELAALIEAATASDPVLAREVEALRSAFRFGSLAPPADLEGRALGEVRRAVRHRSGWLAGAIFCTLLPMTFAVSGGKVSFFMLRDAPVTAVASLLAGAVMWVLFARTIRAIR